MKYLTFGVISLLTFIKLNAQPTVQIPIESSLMKAIDWYIDTTTKYLNEIANENNQITSNGIVAIEFLSQRDTIQVIRDSENRVIKISYPRKFTFRINMFAEILAREPLPSYYFIRGKTPVIIYTGVENLFEQNEDGLNKYKKTILNNARGFKQVSSIKAYLIEIIESNPNEFKFKEISNSVTNYYSK